MPTFLTAQTGSETPQEWVINSIDSNSVNEQNSRPAIEIIRATQGEYLKAQKSGDNILIFQGGIILKIRNQILKADLVKYNQSTGEIYGEGHISLDDGIQLIEGDNFIYDNKHQYGIIYNAKGTLEPVYYIGSSIKIASDDSYVLSIAEFSDCEADSPHYHFKARKIWIRKNNQITALGIIYYVSSLPVFYLPVMVQTDLGTGIYTLYGYQKNMGHYAQNTYFFGFHQKKNNILPSDGALMYDYYQYSGWYLGNYIEKKSDFLNYEVKAGVARYHYRNIIQTPNGISINTNLIQKPDGSIGKKDEYWYELNGQLKGVWKKSFQQDASSSMYVNVFEYNNYAFQSNFGFRHIPTSTMDAIWYNRLFPHSSSIPNYKTYWEFQYSENWAESNFLLKIRRDREWNSYKQSEYKYYPLSDILPEIQYKRSWYLVDPVYNSIFGGIRNEINLLSSMKSSYLRGTKVKDEFGYNMNSVTRIIFPFTTFFSVNPGIGYGIQKIQSYYTTTQPASLLEDKRKSYQYYLLTGDILLGVPLFLLQATYENKMAYKPDYQDLVFNDQISHKVDLSFSSDFYPFYYLNVYSSRDLRGYPYPVKENKLWDPLSFLANTEYDFSAKITSFGYVRKKKHYNTIGLENLYQYNIQFLNHANNNLTFYYAVGGYRILYFKELVYLKTGVGWYHDFLNPFKNKIYLVNMIELMLNDYWKILGKFESKAEKLTDSTKSNPYSKFNSKNIKANGLPFSIDSMNIAVEHDLHRWVLRLSYSYDKSWLSFGTYNESWLGYYEQSVYFSITLKSFGGFGISQQQLYHYTPYDSSLIN